MGKNSGFCCFGLWKRKKGSDDDDHEREEEVRDDVVVANQYKVRPTTDECDEYYDYSMPGDPDIDSKATAFLKIKRQQIRNNGASEANDVSK